MVKTGETILVTERDEVVAEIRAYRGKKVVSSDLEETMDLLADAGVVTRAGLSKEGWSWKVRGLGLPVGTSQALLDDLRGDR